MSQKQNVFQIAGRRPKISREMHVVLQAAANRARTLEDLWARWGTPPRGVKSELREIRRAIRSLAPSVAERDRLLASTRSGS